MKHKRKVIIKVSVVLGLLVWACQTDDNASLEPEVIRINPVKTQSVKRSELFELERIIWLESAMEMPIGGRDGLGLLALNEQILVSSKAVGFFNLEGQFLHTVGEKGKGPGEYLSSFKTEPCQGRLRLLDRSGQKFLDYNFKGEFQEEYHLGIYPNNFTCLDTYTIVYMGYEPNDPNKLLLLYDKNMKLADSCFEMDLEKTRYLNAFSVSNFFHYKDSVRYINPFENTIWNIDVKGSSMQVLPRYFVDFGEYSIPDDFYQQSFPSVMEYHQELTTRGLGHSLWAYWENEFNVFFVYSFRNQRLLGIYCKKSKKSVTVDEIEDDMLFRGDNLPVFAYESLFYYPVGDQVYFVMEAWKFRELMQQTQESMTEKQWWQYTQDMPDIIRIFEKIEDFDNPVIFVFNMTEFAI